MEKKTVVKIDADGELVKCAVGAGDGCGYRAGAKVCGKCGAMAMQTKTPEALDEEDDVEDAIPDDEDEMKAMWAAEDAEDDTRLDLKPMGKKVKKPTYRAEDYVNQLGTDEEGDADSGVGIEREADEDVADEDNTPYRMLPKKKGPVIGDDLDDTLMGENRRKKFREKEYGMGTDLDETLMQADRRKKMRGRRLESMGMKSDSLDMTDVYLCGDTREVKSLQAHDCGNCTGACYSTSGEIDLLDVEAMAEDTLNAKALYSAYSESKNMFAVRMQRKDGQHIDAFYTGDGELDGWFRVPEEDLAIEEHIIGLETAIKSAITVIDGIPGEHTISEFEGLEAYAIEVDGIDGKSYDVYVDPLSGEVLGYDEYEYVNTKGDDDETEDADVADDDVEEKRDYSADTRTDLADEGLALPDGSFPIKDEADLKNAIQAYGRAKDKEAAKAHIMKRAKDLGLDDLVPEDWMAAKSLEASLMEFELLAVEEELRGLIEGE